MAMKDWENQTTETQKSYGVLQYINKKDNTQISISKWEYDKPPKNWQFVVSNVEEARKGYPNNKLGITKSEAMRLLKNYMRNN